MTQQSSLVTCFATSSGLYPSPPPAASSSSSESSSSSSSTSADPPRAPMTASGAYFSMTSGGWIMSNSAVASLPANVRIASSPPGCCDKKLVTSSTRSFRTTQQSVFVMCFSTSAMVRPPPPDFSFFSFFSFFGLAAPSALFMPSSYEPPAFLDDLTSPVRPPPERSLRLTGLQSAPSMYLVAARPATRPKTTQSSSELPPRRLFPCTPPATSPAAYNPLITLPPAPTTAESQSISRPPMQ